MADQRLGRLPAFIAFAVDADQSSRILSAGVDAELGVGYAQRALTHHMLDPAAGSAAARIPLHKVALAQFARCSTIGFTIARGFLELNRIEVMLGQPRPCLSRRVLRAAESDRLNLRRALLDPVDEVNA